MGGFGSTRWGQHAKKTVAEDCLIVDIGPLLREARRLYRRQLDGAMTWGHAERPDAGASCAFTLDMADPYDAWLELRYYAGMTPIVCRIALIRAPAFGGHHGGFRWTGLCPADDWGRHVRKVFCHPFIPYFRCAICHDLTYRSRQMAHWDDRGDMAAAAKLMGIPLPLWKASLRRFAQPFELAELP